MELDLDGGPHLTVATLCEQALEEKDGVFSIIRMIDRFTVTTTGLDTNTEMPEFQLKTLLFLGFKSGAARGTYEASVVFVDPDGKEDSRFKFNFFCEGEDRGNNIKVELFLTIKRPGLHWFNVLLAEQLMTRVPLRVIHLKTA